MLKPATFSVTIKSTSASALSTNALACCNSSFKGTAASGSIILPSPEPLEPFISFQEHDTKKVSSHQQFMGIKAIQEDLAFKNVLVPIQENWQNQEMLQF